MNISMRWVRDLVPGLSLTPQQAADRLAMLGAPVDDVAELGGPLKDIIIGRVVEAGRHPNADRLSLCSVDAGGGYLRQVVCGAPNVRAGALYPFAPVGAALPDGMVIRKAKIRGEESQGMLCSARELGLGRDHDGILELHGDLTPGDSFVEATGLDDARLEVDVTPNRPDLLSHFGVAREIAAAEGLAVGLHDLPGAPDVTVTLSEGGASNGGPSVSEGNGGTSVAEGDGVTVTIEDTDLCPRYFGLVIRGVRVGPSPAWLASRLRAVGLRPISNVVDATNFVLHELGHPLHAFDLDRIGGTVVVRRARAGERIKTLDGVDRALTADMLVIADAERPIAIAGVMGGADSEVHDETRDILLECALFDARSVRATRRQLGLSTDASYRFERGVDADGMQQALERAAQLIIATAGGSVADNAAAAGKAPEPPSPVSLRLTRVAQVLGERFDAATVATLLEPLGFGVRGEGATLHVSVPGHRRHDVAREEDLIEEIARRHGYDAFSDELRPFRPGAVPEHPLFGVEDALRRLLIGRGFMEAHTAAFVPESDGDVPLLLPLAATESRLRRSLLPGLVRRVEYNFARAARNIRLFELGTVFTPPDDAATPPGEETRLAVIMTGLREPAHWSGGAHAFDVWDVKALAGAVADSLGCRVETQDHAETNTQVLGSNVLDPAMSFTLLDDDGVVRGSAGRVRPDAVDAPAWADDCWALEIAVTVPSSRAIRYAPLPTQPASERDLALLVAEGTPAAAVAELVRSAGGELLEDVAIFDVYSGEGLHDGVRSIAYRLRFRAADRTLTDEEVDAAVAGVLRRLNEEMGVRQRGQV
jgi:phenylalanyl-tRNA synthetase beta chain